MAILKTNKNNQNVFVRNFVLLASCPWGPATAHGVGILTKLYVIYMERYSSHLGATGVH